MKKCNCPDWAPNIKHMQYMIQIYPEAASEFYNMTSFKYCPFCGTKLQDNLSITIDTDYHTKDTTE